MDLFDYQSILHLDNYLCQAHMNRYLQAYICTHLSFMLFSMYLSFMIKCALIYKCILHANHQELVKLWSKKKKGEGTEMELFKLAKVVERVTHKFLTDVCKEANTWCSLASE